MNAFIQSVIILLFKIRSTVLVYSLVYIGSVHIATGNFTVPSSEDDWHKVALHVYPGTKSRTFQRQCVSGNH